ncbi:MAG: hypothetical protein AB1512_09245 [Thermodesulfobacteriota bacterium]
METGLSPFYLYLVIKMIVWALFAVSFNLVLGYGGMMSFGHAAFFGIGAYTCGLLLVKASRAFRCRTSLPQTRPTSLITSSAWP